MTNGESVQYNVKTANVHTIMLCFDVFKFYNFTIVL